MNQSETDELHKRLENWSRVYADRYRKQCSPGFRLYRSPDVYHDGDTPAVLDIRDANEVQEAWQMLSAQNRVLLGEWWIIKPPLHCIIRAANRIGPLVIRQYSIEHSIKSAEKKLRIALDIRKADQYHRNHNLLTA